MTVSANFTVSVQQGSNPLTVTFTSTSTGSPSYYRWIFGDGGFIEGVNTTTYTYSQAGLYSPILVVSDGVTEDTKIKYNYIIVNQTYVQSQNIIVESFENNGSRDWKFYVDPNMYLVFTIGVNIYKSNTPVIDIGKWTLVEFHPGSNTMYVATVGPGRKKIPCSVLGIGATGLNSSYETYIAENSSMKIDELKITATDDNLDAYFRSLQGVVYYLD